MTDITELAQREKFEAWWERTQHNGNPPRFGWPHWRDGEGYKVDDDDSELDGMWSAWKAAVAELVESLEKSELRLHEVAVACATAEQALEKAQRANAAQDDHINQQQDRIEWLEKGNQYAGKRIAELEESHAQVIQSRDHYKRMTEEGLKQLAESRTVTAAAADVLAERQRQVATEGWTPAHDDEYEHGELADAAGCYALSSELFDCAGEPPRPWPWPDEWWKPTNRRRDLVKAGALILAEIERLDRAAGIKVEAE